MGSPSAPNPSARSESGVQPGSGHFQSKTAGPVGTGPLQRHSDWVMSPPIRRARVMTPSPDSAVVFSGRPDQAGLSNVAEWRILDLPPIIQCREAAHGETACPCIAAPQSDA